VITVIIPTYNRGSILKTTLPSYLKQRYVGKVFVVDDGSTDDTQKILKKIMKVEDKLECIHLSKRKGAPAAKNIALNYVNSEYVLIGEDDVELSKNYTEELLECLKETNGSGASGRIVYIKENENKKDALRRTNKIKDVLIDTKNITGNFQLRMDKPVKIPFTHAITLFKKSVFDKFKYDENYIGNAYREETDFTLQLSKEGHKLFYCPSAICYHLPRKKVNFGGQRAMNRLSYELFTIINNVYFLRKHYEYLCKEFGINYSRLMLNILFIINRIKKQFSYLGLTLK